MITTASKTEKCSKKKLQLLQIYENTRKQNSLTQMKNGETSKIGSKQCSYTNPSQDVQKEQERQNSKFKNERILAEFHKIHKGFCQKTLFFIKKKRSYCKTLIHSDTFCYNH